MEETWTPGPKLVEETIFREVYYHPILDMSNFCCNQSKSDKLDCFHRASVPWLKYPEMKFTASSSQPPERTVFPSSIKI